MGTFQGPLCPAGSVERPRTDCNAPAGLGYLTSLHLGSNGYFTDKPLRCRHGRAPGASTRTCGAFFLSPRTRLEGAGVMLRPLFLRVANAGQHLLVDRWWIILL